MTETVSLRSSVVILMVLSGVEVPGQHLSAAARSYRDTNWGTDLPWQGKGGSWPSSVQPVHCLDKALAAAVFNQWLMVPYLKQVPGGVGAILVSVTFFGFSSDNRYRRLFNGGIESGLSIQACPWKWTAFVCSVTASTVLSTFEFSTIYKMTDNYAVYLNYLQRFTISA